MEQSLHDIRKERQEQVQIAQDALARVAALEQMEQKLLAEEERAKEVDFSMFTGITDYLLTTMWLARNHFLSTEDIRDLVCRDEKGNPGKRDDPTVRTIICRTRAEMRAYKNCQFELVTVSTLGYKLRKRTSVTRIR